MADISKGKSVELRATLTQRGEVSQDLKGQGQLKGSLKEKENGKNTQEKVNESRR